VKPSYYYVKGLNKNRQNELFIIIKGLKINVDKQEILVKSLNNLVTPLLIKSKKLRFLDSKFQLIKKNIKFVLMLQLSFLISLGMEKFIIFI